ncbi:hypothetical protein Bpla01_01270 [Burkholderia plantarii]|nr:hypothetical protein Bpla01_01270 [Burkholderia plantarii]
MPGGFVGFGKGKEMRTAVPHIGTRVAWPPRAWTCHLLGVVTGGRAAGHDVYRNQIGWARVARRRGRGTDRCRLDALSFATACHHRLHVRSDASIILGIQAGDIAY